MTVTSGISFVSVFLNMDTWFVRTSEKTLVRLRNWMDGDIQLLLLRTYWLNTAERERPFHSIPILP